MIPALFSTQEEIIKKLRSVAKVHTFENAQTISHIFYDVFKITYYALVRKKEGLKTPSSFPIVLKRKEVTHLMKLIDYHHCNDKTFTDLPPKKWTQRRVGVRPVRSVYFFTGLG